MGVPWGRAVDDWREREDKMDKHELEKVISETKENLRKLENYKDKRSFSIGDAFKIGHLKEQQEIYVLVSAGWTKFILVDPIKGSRWGNPWNSIGSSFDIPAQEFTKHLQSQSDPVWTYLGKVKDIIKVTV